MSRFARMRAREKPRAGDEGKKKPGTPPEKSEGNEDENDEQENDDMTEEEKAAAAASAAASKAAEEQAARMNAVIASEHYAGNEKTATAMLANASMSADQIIGVLATIEKPQAGADTSQEDVDKKAQELADKRVQAIVNGQNNADHGNGDDPAASDKDGRAVMAGAMAKVVASRKAMAGNTAGN